MPGWQDEQQFHRRFPHRGRKNGGTGRGESFQPRNMLGRYAVRSVFFDKLARGGQQEDDNKELWLEIHELVESQTGFLASFDFGAVSGVMVIAGSRKELRNIVEELDTIDEQTASESDDEVERSSEGETDDGNDSFISAPELDRPAHAFEKNTFRTPKWFAQWRGMVSSYTASTSDIVDASKDDIDDEAHNGDPPQQNPDKEGDSTANNHTIQHRLQSDIDNKAHFEFSSATCRDFQATFTCSALGAREVTLQGWKITGKSSPATLRWIDFAS